MIRLRQVALVARDLERTTATLCDLLGTEVCYRDPGVAEFGLANTLMLVGDQFLEVVSPTKPGTTAGRLLDKHHADVTGYMVIYEVDDLDVREATIIGHGVRVVWRGDFADIRGRHLHPADIGGAIVSIDQPVPQGAWRWGGPSWQAHSSNDTVTGIAGAHLATADPAATQQRWRQLGLAHAVDFTAAGVRGSGIDVVDVVAADRSRAGEHHDLDALRIRLV